MNIASVTLCATTCRHPLTQRNQWTWLKSFALAWSFVQEAPIGPSTGLLWMALGASKHGHGPAAGLRVPSLSRTSSPPQIQNSWPSGSKHQFAYTQYDFITQKDKKASDSTRESVIVGIQVYISTYGCMDVCMCVCAVMSLPSLMPTTLIILETSFGFQSFWRVTFFVFCKRGPAAGLPHTPEVEDVSTNEQKYDSGEYARKTINALHERNAS